MATLQAGTPLEDLAIFLHPILDLGTTHPGIGTPMLETFGLGLPGLDPNGLATPKAVVL